MSFSRLVRLCAALLLTPCAALECAPGCTDALQNDGECHAACNVAACGHVGCSVDEAIEACLKHVSWQLREPPDAAPDVSTHVSIVDGLGIVFDPATSYGSVVLHVAWEATWRDERLLGEENACRRIMPQVLGLTRTDATVSELVAEHERRATSFWLPMLRMSSANGLNGQGQRTSLMAPKLQELRFEPQGGSASNTSDVRAEWLRPMELGDGLMRLRADTIFHVPQELYLLYYPFDQHNISVDIQYPQAPLGPCNASLLSAPFPFHSGGGGDGGGGKGGGGDGARGRRLNVERWPDHAGLDGLDDEKFHAEWLPQNGKGCGEAACVLPRPGVDDGTCRLELYVKRNWRRYTFSELLPALVVVLAGLLGLWLNPTQAPLVGARVSLLVIAILLVVQLILTQTAFYIGMTMRAIVSLLQIFFLAFGLAETFYVHHKISTGHVEIGLSLDQTWRIFLPLAYLIAIISLVLIANQHIVFFSFFFSFGAASLTVSFYLFYIGRLAEKLARRRRALERLARSNPNDPEAKALLLEGFRHFDLDSSGDIDVKEVVNLVRALYPQMPARDARELVKTGGFLDQGPIEPKTFLRTLREISRCVGAAVESCEAIEREGGEGARSRASTSSEAGRDSLVQMLSPSQTVKFMTRKRRASAERHTSCDRSSDGNGASGRPPATAGRRSSLRRGSIGGGTMAGRNRSSSLADTVGARCLGWTMPSTHLLRFSRADGGSSEAGSREASVADRRGSTDEGSRRGSCVPTMPSVDEQTMPPPPPTPMRPAATMRKGSYGEGRLSRMIEAARMQGGNPLAAMRRNSSVGSAALDGRFGMPSLGRSPTSTSVGASTSTDQQSKRNEGGWEDEPSERDERDEGASSEHGSSPGASFTQKHDDETDLEAAAGGLELSSLSSCVGPFQSIREASRSQEALMTRM